MELAREIMFRGQTRRHGEKVLVSDGKKIPSQWAYGGIFPGTGDFSVIYGWYNGEDQTGANLKKLTVYSDTVGQYTGLRDKNGVRIFEGDIVTYGDTIHRVVFEQRYGTAYFGLVYSEIETLPFGHYQDLRQICVVGNIYDNPELLQGEGGGPG